MTGIPAPPRKGQQGASGPSARPAEPDSEQPEASAVSADSEHAVDEDAPTVGADSLTVERHVDIDGLPEDAPTEIVDTASAADADPELPEDAPTEVVHTDDPDALIEDDSPILGGDLEVPDLEDGDDAPAAPDEIAAHLHTAPPTPSEPADLSGGVPDEDLVAFDETPDGEDLPEPEVSEDLEVSVDPPSATPPPVPRDVEDASDPESLGDLPPGFDATDQLRSGTPHSPPPRQTAPVPGFDVEDDGFLEDADDPPSEDEPSAVPEDIANMYRAPMNVPEPPPIPGILDRYTPAPTRRDDEEGEQDGPRREFRPVKPGGAEAPVVRPPRGLWDETPMPSVRDRTPTPPPVVRPAAPPPDRPMWQDPWLITAVGVAFVAALVVVGLLMAYMNLQPGPDSVDPGNRPTTISPTVPSGAPPSGMPDGTAPDGDPGAMPTADPTAPEDPPAGRTDVDTTPKTPSADSGTRSTTPPRQPEPQARTGKLRISATRSVLVYVNGVPEGYTPLSLDKPAGKYVITAQVNGREVEKRVDLASGSIRSVDF